MHASGSTGNPVLQSLPLISFILYFLYIITAEPSLDVVQTQHAPGFVSFVQGTDALRAPDSQTESECDDARRIQGSEAEEVTGNMVKTKNDERANGSVFKTIESFVLSSSET